MTNKEVINFLNQVRKIILDDKSWLESTIQPINEAFDMAINALTAQPEETHDKRTETHACDYISRQDAIDAHCEICGDRGRCNSDICPDMEVFQLLPSAQPEQLTDNEKRIFLAAMTREELICLQIDEKHNDPNLVNLVGMCHEITRKVKGALWTI